MSINKTIQIQLKFSEFLQTYRHKYTGVDMDSWALSNLGRQNPKTTPVQLREIFPNFLYNVQNALLNTYTGIII